MGIKQISIFLQNTSGRLGEVTRVLAKAGINLRAVSIADTSEYGILRLIVDNTDKAIEALNTAGFTTNLKDVVAVEIDDSPGSLAKLMELFEQAQINIEYLYASLEGQAGKAVVIFKLLEHEKGLKILNDNSQKIVEKF